MRTPCGPRVCFATLEMELHRGNGWPAGGGRCLGESGAIELAKGGQGGTAMGTLQT